MHLIHFFKILPVASAALLVACGGGNDAPTVVVPFASPAMIVPPGAASKSIALSDCDDGLQTATLVVNSAGDMIFSGAPFGTTTISEINRINYASATEQRVSGYNSSSGPGAAVVQYSASNDYLSASVYSSGSYFYSQKDSSPEHSYRCSLAGGSASFVLTTLPSSARLSSQMLSGITGVTTTASVTATFASGTAFWDNWPVGNPNNATNPNTAIRHFSLNMSTGAFTTSPTPNTVGTTYNVSIPTTPTSTYAIFSERIESSGKRFTVVANTPSSGTIKLDISRIGNLLRPSAAVYFE